MSSEQEYRQQLIDIQNEYYDQVLSSSEISEEKKAEIIDKKQKESLEKSRKSYEENQRKIREQLHLRKISDNNLEKHLRKC